MSGLLPPLYGVRKKIHGTRGSTLVGGGFGAPFDVVGLELHYRAPFNGFVDVLTEVSERTSCSSNTDLLRLYEKWLKTGSRRSGQLLVERGVVPNASSTTRVQ